MSKYVIGADVGGTSVKLGLVAPTGRIIARSSILTRDYAQTPATLTAELCRAVKSLADAAGLSRRDIAGVGVGLPGLVDFAKGVVRILPNIPGWTDVPLRRVMEKKLGWKVCLENDVNMITLGEWRYGAGRKSGNIICITLGTGVGGGLILDNKIYRGPGFAAGEIGHVPLNEEGPKCGCGGWGCFEQYVGHRQLQKQAAELFGREDIGLEEVSRLAKAGQRKALDFWDRTGVKVAAGLIGPVNILNPECIIIGGGVARSFEFMKPAIDRVIQRRCMKVQASMVRVICARLGDDAGLAGAQVLVGQDKE